MDKKNKNQDEIDFENIRLQHQQLEEKSIIYRLKRWEKELMKKLKNLISSFKFFKEHKEEIKRQNIKLNEDIKKEMENLEIEKKEIIQKKEESIIKMEIDKQNLIKANDEKYNEILTYINSIKNDKTKLIEFLKKGTILANFDKGLNN